MTSIKHKRGDITTDNKRIVRFTTKTQLVKSVWYCLKDRSMRQNCESRKKNNHDIYGQLIFNKDAKTFHGEKSHLFNKW